MSNGSEMEDVEDVYFKGQSDNVFVRIDHRERTAIRGFFLDLGIENYRKNRRLYEREMTMLQRIQHANIVKMIHFEVMGSLRTIHYEYIGRETLQNVIFDARCSYTVNTVLKYMFGLFDALDHLQELGFVHRDIKPSNVLIRASDNQALLGDLESTKVVLEDRSSTNQCGTFRYAPPEVFAYPAPRRIRFDAKGDVYSIGIVMWELIMRRACFTSLGGFDEPIAENKWKAPRIRCRWELSEIVDACTAHTRKFRCSAKTARQQVCRLRQEASFQHLPHVPNYDTTRTKIQLPRGVDFLGSADWEHWEPEMVDQLSAAFTTVQHQLLANEDDYSLKEAFRVLKKNLGRLRLIGRGAKKDKKKKKTIQSDAHSSASESHDSGLHSDSSDSDDLLSIVWSDLSQAVSQESLDTKRTRYDDSNLDDLYTSDLSNYSFRPGLSPRDLDHPDTGSWDIQIYEDSVKEDGEPEDPL